MIATLGLALYLWPALTAPVVTWSDSLVDLEWARQGAGIVTPVVGRLHPAKPLYLLFLRTADGLGGTRGIVLIQSMLLWISITGTALLSARRLGAGWGATIGVFLLVFLRTRDSASAVMTEALATAIVLPLVVVALDLPRRPRRLVGIGIAMAALFLVRPNVAAIALVGLTLAIPPTRKKALLPILGAFLLITVPWSLITHPAGSPMRGLDHAFAVGGRDYGWAISGDALRSAPELWRSTLAEPGPDLRRQLFWRGFHGLLGTEFYDSRWALSYQAIDEVARTASPFLILLAIAVLLAAPWRERTAAKVMGLSIVILLVAQSVAWGGLPRYALPLLPVLLVLALTAAATTRWSWKRGLAVATLLALLIAGTAWQRQITDREAGILEAEGLRLTQRIPRGALSFSGPATLHVRIGTFLVPSGVRWSVVGPSQEPLLDSESIDSSEPYLTIPIPESLRTASALGPMEIALSTRGAYDPGHYLWYPVIPPPWGSGARRDGSVVLSPATGIAGGSVDWWVHSGAD